ncbi:hypothetical protein CI610_03079 [invertebrate metagenome]|uniref:Uncharacterized protein n=1 Tax=invertebrate metagenome TaxID=1711999 RepID=A0A2H9T461_9ZZZZ
MVNKFLNLKRDSVNEFQLFEDFVTAIRQGCWLFSCYSKKNDFKQNSLFKQSACRRIVAVNREVADHGHPTFSSFDVLSAVSVAFWPNVVLGTEKWANIYPTWSASTVQFFKEEFGENWVSYDLSYSDGKCFAVCCQNTAKASLLFPALCGVPDDYYSERDIHNSWEKTEKSDFCEESPQESKKTVNNKHYEFLHPVSEHIYSSLIASLLPDALSLLKKMHSTVHEDDIRNPSLVLHGSVGMLIKLCDSYKRSVAIVPRDWDFKIARKTVSSLLRNMGVEKKYVDEVMSWVNGISKMGGDSEISSNKRDIIIIKNYKKDNQDLVIHSDGNTSYPLRTLSVGLYHRNGDMEKASKRILSMDFTVMEDWDIYPSTPINIMGIGEFPVLNLDGFIKQAEEMLFSYRLSGNQGQKISQGNWNAFLKLKPKIKVWMDLERDNPILEKSVYQRLQSLVDFERVFSSIPDKEIVDVDRIVVPEKQEKANVSNKQEIKDVIVRNNEPDEFVVSEANTTECPVNNEKEELLVCNSEKSEIVISGQDNTVQQNDMIFSDACLEAESTGKTPCNRSEAAACSNSLGSVNPVVALSIDDSKICGCDESNSTVDHAGFDRPDKQSEDGEGVKYESRKKRKNKKKRIKNNEDKPDKVSCEKTGGDQGISSFPNIISTNVLVNDSSLFVSEKLPEKEESISEDVQEFLDLYKELEKGRRSRSFRAMKKLGNSRMNRRGEVLLTRQDAELLFLDKLSDWFHKYFTPILIPKNPCNKKPICFFSYPVKISFDERYQYICLMELRLLYCNVIKKEYRGDGAFSGGIGYAYEGIKQIVCRVLEKHFINPLSDIWDDFSVLTRETIVHQEGVLDKVRKARNAKLLMNFMLCSADQKDFSSAVVGHSCFSISFSIYKDEIFKHPKADVIKKDLCGDLYNVFLFLCEEIERDLDQYQLHRFSLFEYESFIDEFKWLCVSDSMLDELNEKSEVLDKQMSVCRDKIKEEIHVKYEKTVNEMIKWLDESSTHEEKKLEKLREKRKEQRLRKKHRGTAKTSVNSDKAGGLLLDTIKEREKRDRKKKKRKEYEVTQDNKKASPFLASNDSIHLKDTRDASTDNFRITSASESFIDSISNDVYRAVDLLEQRQADAALALLIEILDKTDALLTQAEIRSIMADCYFSLQVEKIEVVKKLNEDLIHACTLLEEDCRLCEWPRVGKAKLFEFHQRNEDVRCTVLENIEKAIRENIWVIECINTLLYKNEDISSDEKIIDFLQMITSQQAVYHKTSSIFTLVQDNLLMVFNKRKEVIREKMALERKKRGGCYSFKPRSHESYLQQKIQHLIQSDGNGGSYSKRSYRSLAAEFARIAQQAKVMLKQVGQKKPPYPEHP